MPIYFVDDGGSSTAPFDTWAKAATSLSALDDDVALAAGDTIYIGHNSIDQYEHAAHRTITGATSGIPISIISATQGSDPPTYAVGTANQIDTTEGAYDFTLSGGFCLYGVQIAVGRRASLSGGGNYSMCHHRKCKIILPANEHILLSNTGTLCILEDITVDLSADGTTNRSGGVFPNNGTSSLFFRNLSFINAGYRTGDIFLPHGSSGNWTISGCDFSGFTNGTACELVNVGNIGAIVTMSNCLTAATWTPATSGSPNVPGRLTISNTGPADAPTYLYINDRFGILVSSSAIYRTGGATIEGDATSWLIVTTANSSEHVPFYTPWIYGTISSTGSKTFTCFITNDTSDFTDAQVWLEIEYLKDADEAIWTLATDQRATITTTPVAQTDDTTSEWVEISGSGTYSQTGTTMTVTDTAHGLIVGNAIVLDCTSGDGNDGTYTIVTVPTADTFTVTSSTSETVSGNCTWQMAPLYTYKQSLAVTATVGETGQYRARVAVGVASIAASRYFYVDPKITVS
jgi:hypothetical protein